MRRDALMDAMLPSPGPGLPGLGEIDLTAFWAEFDRVAPVHLRLGLWASALVLVTVLPRLLGHRRALDRLDRADQERVLERGAALFPPLVLVAKLVAALAWCEDPRVDAALRSAP